MAMGASTFTDSMPRDALDVDAPNLNSPFTNGEPLRPIVAGWLGKLSLASSAKKSFNRIAKQCESFFSGDTGEMWNDENRSQWMRGNISPKFKMTMNKAFELVALFGPTLYWKNPQRRIEPRKCVQITQALLASMPDPVSQQIAQETQQTSFAQQARRSARAELVQEYLNYTPDQQPDGGLAGDAEKALTETLVKGAGVLWVEPYRLPGSTRTLTGSFYDSIDNLLIDPDSETMQDALWIARRHVVPTWKAERTFQLKRGSLRRSGDMRSTWSAGEVNGDDLAAMHTAEGQTHDLITYYEIWSKGGVGQRLTNMDSPLKEALDSVVGDYAYVVVSPGVTYPLNAPPERFLKASDEEVKQMFGWPTPYWMLGLWPCWMFSFYHKPRKVWPIAPMAPGLGELIFINVMVSHLCNRVWSSMRTIIAVLKSAASEVKKELQSGDDLSVIELNDIQQSIDRVVSFLNQPPLSMDAWKILEEMMQVFDRRTGISEILAGLNAGGVQSRSAEDVRVKNNNASIRPEYMAGKVEAGMRQCARLEKFAARWHVTANDVQPLFGNAGAYLWQQLIEHEDPELVVHEQDVTIEAGSGRRPNKDRDADNMNRLMPVLLPVFEKYASDTSDTGPLNTLISEFGQAIDQDLSNVTLGQWHRPPPPPPDPQQQQQQAAQAQLQMQLMQARVADTNAQAQHRAAQAQVDLAGSQHDVVAQQTQAAMEQRQMAVEQQKTQSDAALANQQAQVKLQSDAALQQMELVHAQQKHEQAMQQQNQAGMLKLMLTRANDKLSTQAKQHKQGM